MLQSILFFVSPQLLPAVSFEAHRQGVWDIDTALRRRLLPERRWGNPNTSVPQLSNPEGASCLHKRLQYSRSKATKGFLPEGFPLTLKTYSRAVSDDLRMLKKGCLWVLNDAIWWKPFNAVWFGFNQIRSKLQPTSHIRCFLSCQRIRIQQGIVKIHVSHHHHRPLSRMQSHILLSCIQELWIQFT